MAASGRTLRAGGTLATLSNDGGLVWPTPLIGLALLGFRRIWHYAAWLVAALLSTLPYTVLMVFARPPGATTAHSLKNVQYIVAAIGLPFVNGFPSPVAIAPATHIGLLGIAPCLTGLVLLCSRGLRVLALAAPGLMVVVYSLANVWVISAFRGQGTAGLAPWYTGHFMLFWIGLVALAYVLWVNPRDDRRIRPRWMRTVDRATPLWVAGVILLLSVLYSQSNLTIRDKATCLFFRAPVSASCLRNFLAAPPVFHQYVFQWGAGTPGELPLWRRLCGNIICPYSLPMRSGPYRATTSWTACELAILPARQQPPDQPIGQLIRLVSRTTVI